MSDFPSLSDTDPSLSPSHRRALECRLLYYYLHPDAIDDRLSELEQEWSQERALQFGTSSVGLTGFVLSMLKSKVFLLLPLTLLTALLRRTWQGNDPVGTGLTTRLGLRTQHEIAVEQAALLILRRDLDRTLRKT